MYVALWSPLRTTMLYLGVMAAAYVLGLMLSGWQDMASAWLIIIVPGLGLAFVVNSLVRALRSAATMDQLTGLPNRRGLDAAIASGSNDRRRRPRTLVVIDLDDFKKLNDSLGHLAGDEALRSFGDAVNGCLRPEDDAFRRGGDEFVLILNGASDDDIEPVLSRLRTASSIGWTHGVAPWPIGTHYDAAMASADRSLYANKAIKKSGRPIEPA